mgnify:CR=1 FL=1
MTKARFYIRGKVQDVGYRPYIMKEVIKREGLNGIADNYSQALTFEQLGKGIPILKSMGKSIEGAREEVREGFERMDKNFERLPKEIAKELRDLLEGKIRR